MSSHITFDGNLAEDPAFGTSDAGVCYTRLVVISNDRYRNRAGDWTTGPAVRHRVTAFHRLAENAAATFRKGDPVLVAGTETVTDYTDRDGNPRTGREIIADHLGVSLTFATAAIHRNTKSVDTTADPSWA